jgi:8-oxo-dGTP diphosphatase
MKKPQKQTIPESFDWGQFLPGLAVDCVIFGYSKDELKILILEYKNTKLFSLPGGFIGSEESIDDAAKRVLNDRTGLKNIYLSQFYTFGDIERYDPRPMKIIMKKKRDQPG